jgi:succinoglycan biosynthesis protein ExoV
MRVLVYRRESGVSNFGDSLNLWLWDKLLPQAGSVLRPDLIFLGIGTLLNAALPPGPKLVFGAGAGYGPTPEIDSTWDIRFVRGYDSAMALDLDPVKAILDPAYLVGFLMTRKPQVYPVSLMPRFDSVTEILVKRCREAGVHLIDPRGSVETILPRIASSGLLLSETLHGAIVADALRIPWLPILTDERNRAHAFKWRDWLSVFPGMDYDPVVDLDWTTGHNTDPKQLKPLLLRLLDQLTRLRKEINTHTGPFAVSKEARA